MTTLHATPPDTSAAALRERAGDIAGNHRDVWHNKPVLREVYADVYRRISEQLSNIEGPVIELGGGPGLTRQFIPNIISSDVAAAQWLDFAGDAHRLPLADDCAANLILIDVLHHLARPQVFFSEVSRVLKPGGRIVIVDMYLSAMSWPVLHFAHPEPATLSIRPMSRPAHEPLFDDDDPWCSDQGIARALFWKQQRQFNQRFKQLTIVHQSRFSTILWPMSGGFEHKDRVPAWALPMLRRLDHWLERLGQLTAFRSMVVLEKQDKPSC